MKYALLSADSMVYVYYVPDVVAENLAEHCIQFCDRWLHESPHAKKYRRGHGYSFTQHDFIDYLNCWVFPDQPSSLIANLGNDYLEGDEIPEKYRECPYFNF